MFAINKLLFLNSLLGMRIKLLALNVWVREIAYHAVTRYSFATGVVLRAAGDADDIAAQIAAAVDEAVAGLKDQNKRLTGELRAARAKGKDVDHDEVERLRTEVETLTDQVANANKEVKTLTTRAEKAEATAAAESAAVSKLVVENGLMSALSAANVTDPDFVAAAASMIRGGQKIELAVDGDTRTATIGGKPLADFVSGWAASDAGKKFVTAPANGGGGSGGPGGKVPPVNPFAKDTQNLTAAGQMYKDNPAQAKAMAAEAGIILP